jgi:Zn-dependent protease/CBS domain-containing protein
MMPGALRVGKIAGINVFIHVSWLIILALLTWSLARAWFLLYPGWTTSILWVTSLIAALLLFVSVLFHEIAHSVVARALGLPVKNITLFIFGGVSNIEQEPKSPSAEFKVTIVGPLTSLLLSVLAYFLFLAIPDRTSPLAAILYYLAFANLLLGVFNLIPGFPLDGGRVLRSILWQISKNVQSATRIATGVGQIVAYLFILWGIWLFFGGAFLSGLWIGFIGWFLLYGAQTAGSQVALEALFKGVTVNDVMNHDPIKVPANISLQTLVDLYLLPHGRRHAFVMQLDRFAGLITLTDIRHTPRDQWANTPVGLAMTPVDQLCVVSPQQSLNEVLSLIVRRNVNQVPVVVNGDLVGVLSREDIMRLLEVRRGLGLKDTEQIGMGRA